MDKNIDLRYFFINHYSSSGKLYAVEYKGNPLELQNAIKRLQEENEGLKSLNDFNVQKIEVLQEENEELKKKKDEYYLINLDYETKISYLIQALEEINILAKNYCNACDEFKAKTYKALEEIRNIAKTPIITEKNRFDEITNKINEVLND